MNDLTSSQQGFYQKIPAVGMDRTQNKVLLHLFKKKQDRSKPNSMLSALRGFQHILFCRPLVCTFEGQHRIDSYKVSNQCPFVTASSAWGQPQWLQFQLQVHTGGPGAPEGHSHAAASSFQGFHQPSGGSLVLCVEE